MPASWTGPGWEAATEEARRLYGRLVVLRHKAREGERPKARTAGRKRQVKTGSPRQAGGPPVVGGRRSPHQAGYPPPDPKQVSLMDVISRRAGPEEKAPVKPLRRPMGRHAEGETGANSAAGPGQGIS